MSNDESTKIMTKSYTASIFICLLLMCSCAQIPKLTHSTIDESAISEASELPAEVTMSKDAGRDGKPLFLTLRLQGGKELPFFVDTGSPVTLFDKSLKPLLGKCLARGTFSDAGGKPQASDIFAAPRLYLNGTPLLTGSRVYTYDFKRLSSEAGRPVMAILGMDCLEHYCIQLDFEDRKIRFMNPDNLDTNQLGKVFRLVFSHIGQGTNDFIRPFIYHANLTGGEDTYVLIDSGWGIDDAAVTRGSFWGHLSGRVHLRECVWDGETYTNLIIWRGKSDALGIRFLARHCVTFDFPKRSMYLKQTRIGPLRSDKTP